jgi:hypothetical protein
MVEDGNHAGRQVDTPNTFKFESQNDAEWLNKVKKHTDFQDAADFLDSI